MVLPKEHGTWMMFFLPYLLGVFLSSPSFIHLPFLIGWFSLFLAATPLLSIIRNRKTKDIMVPWLIIYSVISIAFLIPVIWLYPTLLWIGLCTFPLLIVNIYFIKTKNERSFSNNISGILVFSLGGLAAHVIGEGQWTIEAFITLGLSGFYFTGSAFYVKSLIRERKNVRFKKQSHLYHFFLIALPWMIGIPYLILAFLPGTLKDWITSRKKQMKPIKIGMIEMVNGALFFIVCVAIY
ncbi:YwiC-like family protein [Halalkalibacter alkalisediminis]|uniref:YwiC-like family protein n=1 Tax=Halalkalibacter alkalisediminis TaxID=935616 RepID=A0ABV6NGV6_9BACI|nr:YwiC-like family protein [Halalkalibacter alkalisediminis]